MCNYYGTKKQTVSTGEEANGTFSYTVFFCKKYYLLIKENQNKISFQKCVVNVLNKSNSAVQYQVRYHTITLHYITGVVH